MRELWRLVELGTDLNGFEWHNSFGIGKEEHGTGVNSYISFIMDDKSMAGNV